MKAAFKHSGACWHKITEFFTSFCSSASQITAEEQQRSQTTTLDRSNHRHMTEAQVGHSQVVQVDQGSEAPRIRSLKGLRTPLGTYRPQR